MLSVMDRDEQRRRQDEQSHCPRGYVPKSQNRASNTIHTHTVRGAQAGPPDRYRQAQVLTSRPPAPTSQPISAANPQDISSFGYPQGQHYASTQIPGTSFQYQAEYAQDSQRQHLYSQYNPQLLYGVPERAQQQTTY